MTVLPDPAPAVSRPVVKADSKTKRRRRRSPGWVPDHHGAWAMMYVPAGLGMVLSGGAWLHVALLALWTAGYFAFFALGLWLKSRRKSRYFGPVRTYGLITIGLGALVLAWAPGLVVWAPAFIPLLATSLVCSHLRKDRSVLNDGVLVAAAALMGPVMFDAGAGENWAALWAATALSGAYFFGTVLYVKTIIRERGSRGYLVASIGYHMFLVALPLIFGAILNLPGTLALMGAFSFCAVRAVVGPRLTVTPKQVGILEIFVTAAVTCAIVLSLSPL